MSLNYILVTGVNEDNLNCEYGRCQNGTETVDQWYTSLSHLTTIADMNVRV